LKVGLIDIEPKVFNTAYMQIAAYHRGRGDCVEWWTPLGHRLFDRVYCSSIFTYTDKSQVPADAVCGGTGFDLTTKLPAKIENSGLDYTIYPKCQTSYLWFSRGCINDCGFCVVRQKEGFIRAVVPKNLNPAGQTITVMDNNFFANPQWVSAIRALLKYWLPADFQGIDIRRITDEQAQCLAILKLSKQLKFAWDIPADRERVLRGIEILLKYIPAYKCMCYVLIGYDSTEAEDLERVRILWDRYKIDPFVMPFDKREPYQRAFARWVNRKAIFKKVGWVDYKQRVEKREMAGQGWSG